MSSENSTSRERLTRDFENHLIYFANRQKNSVSREEVVDISRRVMMNIDIDNPVIAHKGTSWIARDIINNLE